MKGIMRGGQKMLPWTYITYNLQNQQKLVGPNNSPGSTYHSYRRVFPLSHGCLRIFGTVCRSLLFPPNYPVYLYRLNVVYRPYILPLRRLHDTRRCATLHSLHDFLSALGRLFVISEWILLTSGSWGLSKYCREIDSRELQTYLRDRR